MPDQGKNIFQALAAHAGRRGSSPSDVASAAGVTESELAELLAPPARLPAWAVVAIADLLDEPASEVLAIVEGRHE